MNIQDKNKQFAINSLAQLMTHKCRGILTGIRHVGRIRNIREKCIFRLPRQK